MPSVKCFVSFLNELDAQLKKEFEWQQAKDGTEKKMFGKVWTACCFKAKRVDRFLTFANSRYFDKPTYSQNLIATTQRYVSEVSLYVQNVMRKA